MSNDSFGRPVTHTPNSDTITPSGRLSGAGDYLASYRHSFEATCLSSAVRSDTEAGRTI